jgi:uncharacterized membrane protein YkoI
MYPAYRRNPEYARLKANQHWEMAGLARADGDEADEARHTKLAREWDEKANDYDGQDEAREAARMRLAAEFFGEED